MTQEFSQHWISVWVTVFFVAIALGNYRPAGEITVFADMPSAVPPLPGNRPRGVYPEARRVVKRLARHSTHSTAQASAANPAITRLPSPLGSHHVIC